LFGFVFHFLQNLNMVPLPFLLNLNVAT
jgi:hypothetical protein